MSIFLFILGLVIGFGAKLGIDMYGEWQSQQKKTYLDMEKILVEWKAIEKMKEFNQ